MANPIGVGQMEDEQAALQHELELKQAAIERHEKVSFWCDLC